jgi:hypothetical protein
VIFALHRTYLRTCNACGYRWSVGRAAAGGAGQRRAVAGRRRAIGFTGRTGRQGAKYLQSGDLTRRAGQDVWLEGVLEGLNTCGKCGVDDFTQRPLRKGEEA